MSTARAFSKAFLVRIPEGRMSFSTSSIIFIPVVLAKRIRSAEAARMVPLPGRARPRTSERQFIVLAVNMPAQEPHARAGASFELVELLTGHGAHLDLADGLEDRDEIDVLPLEEARQHGASADDDGRDVEPGRGHEHAGHDLVAVGDEDEAVERICHRHRFDRVGDELPGAQGVFHPFVTHDDPVADADGEEFQGRSPGDAHPGFDRLGDLVEVEVARDDLVGRVGDPDHGPPDLGVGEAQRFEQGAVGSPLESFLHLVRSHRFSILLLRCDGDGVGGFFARERKNAIAFKKLTYRRLAHKKQGVCIDKRQRTL